MNVLILGANGEAFRCALEVELGTLPSRCEVFFVFPDLPHQKFSNEKVKRILAGQAQDSLDHYWSRGGVTSICAQASGCAAARLVNS